MTTAKDRATYWARELINDPRTAFLDTETTGLNGHTVEISIYDLAGRPLFDTLVRPPVPVEAKARSVHGITDEQLAGAPTFAQLWPSLQNVLLNRRIVVYNAAFDSKIIGNDLRHIGARYVGNWECAMLNYAAYVGQWDAYRGSFRWQKLPGAGHRAADDCRATAALIYRMAQIPPAQGALIPINQCFGGR